ncbi:MAG: ATP-binding protein [Nannocystaceae bacterium]
MRRLVAVDRLIPRELLLDTDTRLRSRVLVLCSIGIGTLGLLGLLVRAFTMPRDGNLWAGLGLIAVFFVIPLIQRATRSTRVAGGILSAALIVSLPLFHANFGRFPAPVLLFFPVVPAIVTFFNGVMPGLVATLILSTSVIVLAKLLPLATAEAFAASIPTLTTFAAVSSLISFLLAAVYDRNRRHNDDDLNRINRELTEARRLAEEADRRKTEFLRHMSHELRTPLNAIVGYSQLLCEELDEHNPEYAEDARRIDAASRHLLGLINDLLDISKIEAGSIALLFEEFELRVLLDLLRKTLEPLAKRAGNTLTITVAPEISVIESDRQRLQQVLLNLVGNACKFTENGTVEVRCELTSDGKRVVFTVKDDGIGMTPAAIKRIFEPFVQVEGSSARKRHGSGLGLMITKRLIELLGGSIKVESVPNRGSTFTFDIPLLGAGTAGKHTYRSIN